MDSQKQSTLNASYLALQTTMKKIMPDNPAAFGWKSYSQCDEDGVLRKCLDRISKSVPLTKSFIEVGCGNGLENNTHQLLLDGFSGCWIDGNHDNIAAINYGLGSLIFDRLWVRGSFVTTKNLVQLTHDCCDFLQTSELDVVSFDIDGNDGHLLRLLLSACNPKLICVEYNAKFHPPTSLNMSYSAGHTWATDDYFGVSLQGWVEILTGYSLIACNLSGVNAFFVRDDLATTFTHYEVADLYQPPRYWLAEMESGHNASLKWLRQELVPSEILPLVNADGLLAGQFEFEVHRKLDQYISKDLLRDGIWEPFETELICTLCEKGDYVLDIGANIGWYAVVLSRLVGETGRLTVFEPDADNLEILNRNLSRSAGEAEVAVMPFALGGTDQSAKLYVSETNMGDHQLFCSDSQRSTVETTERSLDSLFEGQEYLPCIVKSDTQGYEGKIVDGAKKLFDLGWRPIWIIEFWPHGLTHAGSDPIELWRRLHAMGYNMYEVSEDNPVLIPISECSLLMLMKSKISVESMGFINILALPLGCDRLGKIADFISH